MAAPRSRRTRSRREPDEEPRAERGRGRRPRKGRISNVATIIGLAVIVVIVASVGILVMKEEGEKRRQDVLFPELRTLGPAIDAFKSAWNSNDAAAIGETIRPRNRKRVVKWLGTLPEKRGWGDRLTRLTEVDQQRGVKNAMTKLVQVPVYFTCPQWGPKARLMVRFEHMSNKWWVGAIRTEEN